MNIKKIPSRGFEPRKHYAFDLKSNPVDRLGMMV